MRNKKVLIYLIVLPIFLIGCQSTTKQNYNPQNSYSPDIFADSAFKHYQDTTIESSDEIFQLNDGMMHLVRKELLPERDHHKRAEKLLKTLFLNKGSEIDYRYGANLTASQAFDSKEANCMSLTIMAYALAEAAGLKATFQDVKVPEYWIRNGVHSMLTGHVNISIKKPRDNNVAIVWGSETIEVDFDPLVAKKSFPKKKISKQTVISMFYNNKGAQYLVEDNYDSAYAYFKAAINADPFFPATWGNLGVLYRTKGMFQLASKAYKHATDLDENNLTALTNYALLLRLAGQIDNATLIENAIHQKRLTNPYYHAMLADEAHFDGNYRKALNHYRKAIKLNKKIHEFYFGLAKVYFDMNELGSAKSQLKKAIRLSKKSSINKKYEAKLSVLNAYNR